MASDLARKIESALISEKVLILDDQGRAVRVIDGALPESVRSARWSVDKKRGVWLWGGEAAIPRGVNLNADIGFAMVLGGEHWERVEAYVRDAAEMGARVLRVGFEVPDRKSNIGYDWAWLCKYGAKLPLKSLHKGDAPLEHFIGSWETYHTAMKRLLALCRELNLYLWVVLGDGGPRSALNLIGVADAMSFSKAWFSSGAWLRQWKVREYLREAWENMILPYTREAHVFAWEGWNEPDIDHWQWAVEGKPGRRVEFDPSAMLYFSEWMGTEFINLGVTQPKTMGLWTFDAAGELLVGPDERKAHPAIAQHATFRAAFDFQDAHYYERGGVGGIIENLKWLRGRWDDEGFKWPVVAGELSFDWDREAPPASSEEISAWMAEKAVELRDDLGDRLGFLLWGIQYNNPEHWNQGQWTYHWNLRSSNGGAAAKIIQGWWRGN